MVKLFVTGDIHIGKKYDRYPDIKDKLIKSRFDCLSNCVKQAEKESCDFFVITGDLFDSISGIKTSDVKEIVDILSEFNGRVLVLPGNHDYYTGEEKVWKDFTAAMAKVDHNIILINKFAEYTFDVKEEHITFYPAFCQSKHSEKNNLDWIKSAVSDDSTYHIGLAHGAIEGLTPDMKNEYFLMSEKELLSIPVDAWLIGHTHIQYPSDLSEEKETEGYRVFNAGTPEQTDLSNGTTGCSFVISLEKTENTVKVLAHKFQSGAIRFFDIQINAAGTFKSTLESAVKNFPKNSIVRATISGSVDASEFADRVEVYDEVLGCFLTYEIDDSNLSETISVEKIRSEFAEIGFAASFLEGLLNDPKEVQMAYDLIKKYQG